jgi:hypothetical protein
VGENANTTSPPTLSSTEERGEINLFTRERQERHEAGAFDGGGQDALVLLAGAGAAGRQDLALAAQKITQNLRVLIIQLIYIFGAEIAGLIHITCSM